MDNLLESAKTYQLKKENFILKQTINNKNISIDLLGDQKMERDKEIKRYKEALTVAYAHCLSDEMDETADMILHVLQGGKVERHWNMDLKEGKEALKEFL